jgi:hypothetical protein
MPFFVTAGFPDFAPNLIEPEVGLNFVSFLGRIPSFFMLFSNLRLLGPMIGLLPDAGLHRLQCPPAGNLSGFQGAFAFLAGAALGKGIGKPDLSPRARTTAR